MSKKERIAVFLPDAEWFCERATQLAESLAEFNREIFICTRQECQIDNSVYSKKIEGLSQLKAMLEEKAYCDIEQILFFDNSFFGPIGSWDKVFESMDGTCADYWGLEYREAYIDEYSKRHKAAVVNYFFAIKRELLLSLPSDVLFDKDIALKQELGNRLEELHFQGDSFVPRQESDSRYTSVEDRSKIRPYDMLTEQQLPILRKACFKMGRINGLEFDFCDQLGKAIGYIEENQLYPIASIFHYLTKYFAPGEIKRLLQLNYIFDPEKKITLSEHVYHKTAIAMHLYYEELFDVAERYIRNIPVEISLFITVKSQQARELLQQKLSFRENIQILISSNVGRDWGALILDLWQYIKDYEYICFVHDKRTTGGNGYPVVGKAFMELSWNGLLHSRDYINQILRILEEKPYIGLLGPETPYHSGYIKLLGDAWTTCLEETEKLAKRIGLKIVMKKEDMPFALSSMFWFRNAALRPVFDYAFQEDDFPKEPMALDGTLNHALERIVTSCALEQGFFSGTVQDIASAQNHILNYQCMLEQTVHDAILCFGEVQCSDIFSGKNYQNRMGLLKYAMKYPALYIYGAGNNGKYVAEFLDYQDIPYDGFIISDNYEKKASFCGHEIFYYGEIEAQAGIVIAVDKRYREDIINYLENKGYHNYYVIQ